MNILILRIAARFTLKNIYFSAVISTLFFVQSTICYADDRGLEYAKFILSIQERIMIEPNDNWLKAKLVQVCYDKTTGKIVAVGRSGRVRKDNISRQNQYNLKRAALTDARRWAAYVMFWKDDLSVSFGKIEVKMDGGQIIFEGYDEENKFIVAIEILST